MGRADLCAELMGGRRFPWRSAVVFDLGGVLERVEDFGAALGAVWRPRLGMSQEEFDAALAAIDPSRLAETGQMNEAEYAERCATCLRLSPAQQEEFIADMWDWYCGELDEELMAFAASLRPRVRTAVVSNSAHGARREELSRYAFDKLFDPIIYSHEVGLAKPDPAIFELVCSRLDVAPAETIFVDDVPGHCEAARQLGVHAIQHLSTPQTIKAITTLLYRLSRIPGARAGIFQEHATVRG
jgi:epoxide hydrolase-like predicted phosphatase